MLNVKTVGGKLDITLSDAKSFKPGGKSKVQQHVSKAGISRNAPRHTKPRSSPKEPQVKTIKAANGASRSPSKLAQKGHLGTSDDFHGKGANKYPENESSDLRMKFTAVTEAGEGKVTSSLHAIHPKQELQLKAEELDRNATTTLQGHSALGSKPNQGLEEQRQFLANSGWNRNQEMPVKPGRNSSKELTAEEYNPWGRPGAGAPLRTRSGNVVADFREMSQNSLRNSVDAKEASGPIPRHFTGCEKQTRQLPGPVETPASLNSNTANRTETAVPVALRSSFAAGAPGLVTKDTQNKSESVKKWREELEMQIREKKERKLKEQQVSEAYDSWSKRSESNKSPSRLVPSEVALQTAVPATPSSVPAPHTDRPPHLSSEDHNSKHVRGYGMKSLSLQSPDEMEKKRAKMLEHQRAIQEQVEEKRRKKREEEDEKRREEAAAEAKLARQRILIQQQFEEDQRRKKEKEEESQRRSEAMKLSVLQAYEAAQQAKLDKRHKHHQVADQVSTLKSSVEEVPLPLPATVLREDVPHEVESPAIETFTPRTGAGPSPAWGGVLRTTYDDHSSYKVDAETSETEEQQNASAPGPVHGNKHKISPKKKTLAASSHSPRGAKSKVVRSRSEETRYRKGEPPQVKTDKTLGRVDIALSPRKQESGVVRHPDYSSPPQSPLLDAFMVPYRRTTSATLHQRQEPPPSLSGASHKQLSRVKPESNFEATDKNQTHPTGLVPLYRSESLNLGDGESSKLSLKQQRPAAAGNTVRKKEGKISSGSVKGSSTTKVATSLTQRTGHKETKKNPDAVRTGSMARDVEEALPTSRQEMIIQQLATLRKGLMMKERELHGGIL